MEKQSSKHSEQAETAPSAEAALLAQAGKYRGSEPAVQAGLPKDLKTAFICLALTPIAGFIASFYCAFFGLRAVKATEGQAGKWRVLSYATTVLGALITLPALLFFVYVMFLHR